MGELRLWAIDIETVRELTPASPMLAGRLRSAAAERFRVPEAENRPTGLVHKLGPLLRVPVDAPRLPPGMPSHNDVEHLVAGRFVTPDKLPKAWTILEAWLDDLCWGRTDVRFEHPAAPGTAHAAPGSLDPVDQAELDLARAGLSSEVGLRRLLGRDAQLRVRPLPGTTVGYCRHEHVLATAAALSQVVGQVEARSSLVAHQVLDHLQHYPEWAEQARAAGRPAPDLFGVLVGEQPNR